MRCSSCYASNPAWTGICPSCGEPTNPIRLCPNGHILPPGAAECPVCPSMWPQPEPFAGLPQESGAALRLQGGLAQPYGELDQ